MSIKKELGPGNRVVLVDTQRHIHKVNGQIIDTLTCSDGDGTKNHPFMTWGEPVADVMRFLYEYACQERKPIYVWIPDFLVKLDAQSKDQFVDVSVKHDYPNHQEMVREESATNFQSMVLYWIFPPSYEERE